MRDAGWRKSNTGTLMYTVTGLCIAEKLRLIHHRFPLLTAAQLALFHHLDSGGTRLTSLAARAGLTKQSMVELVNKASRNGLVDRQSDRDDKRAKIIVPTDEGRRLIAVLAKAVIETDSQLDRILGPALAAEMPLQLGSYTAEALSGSTARLLSLASQRFAGEALDYANSRGDAQVGAVLLALFRNLDLAGTRLTVLASRARMTKQSMRELVDRAEELGLTAREVDPTDARAKVITFTASGLDLLEAIRNGIAHSEARLIAATAPGFVDRMRKGLSLYIAVAGSGNSVR